MKPGYERTLELMLYKTKVNSTVTTKCKTHKSSGRVLMQFREDFKVLKEVKTRFKEVLCVEILPKLFILLTKYNEPKLKKLAFLQVSDENQELLAPTYTTVIVEGDFKMDIVKSC